MKGLAVFVGGCLLSMYVGGWVALLDCGYQSDVAGFLIRIPMMLLAGFIGCLIVYSIWTGK